MPRALRRLIEGESYHVVNRGNDKRVIFATADDYDHFIHLLNYGREHADVSILGFCLMPTHFHLVVQPEAANALSTYMHWVTGEFAKSLRARTGTRGHGHVFQRRFWAAPLLDSAHLLSVLRYVESNALRAGLVRRAQDWRWGSLRERADPAPLILDPCPIALPEDWETWVNLGREEFLLHLLRHEWRRF